jgi:hypothetical protein
MESNVTGHREPWNKGKLVGQKAPFFMPGSIDASVILCRC